MEYFEENISFEFSQELLLIALTELGYSTMPLSEYSEIDLNVLSSKILELKNKETKKK